MIVPKSVFTERFQPTAPYADQVCKTVDEVYNLAGEIEQARVSALTSTEPGARDRFKTALKSHYAVRLDDLAQPLETYRRQIGSSEGPKRIALSNNLALADAAVWSARRLTGSR